VDDLRHAEAVADGITTGDPAGSADAVLQRTWGAWGQGSKEEIDQTIAAMHDEWERSTPAPKA